MADRAPLLSRRVAERIQQWTIQKGWTRLPSIASLAGVLGVSKSTVQKAMHLLAQDGYLDVAPGRSARIVSAATPAPLNSLSSLDGLVQDLTQELARGTRSRGATLPKVAEVARRWSVGGATVLAAYRILVERRLAHRRGRTYRVGPPPHPISAARSQPVVWIVSSDPRSFAYLCENGWARSFGRRFVEEVEKAGMLPTLLPLSGESGALAMDQALEQMSIKKDEHSGALFAISKKQLPQLDTWIESVSSLGRPVVWMDRADEGWDAGRPHSGCLRCYPDSKAAHTLALEFLLHRGHRRIAFVHTGRHAFETLRGRRLGEICQRDFPELSFGCTCPPTREDWAKAETSGLAEMVQSMERQDFQNMKAVIRIFRRQRDSLLRALPPAYAESASRHSLGGLFATSLARMDAALKQQPLESFQVQVGKVWSALALYPVLVTQRATALLAPNDSIAWSYHRHWLRDLGLEVPRDLSLMSFDNSYPYHLRRLTSVDPGLSQAAVQAVNWLRRDWPVHRDSHGDLPFQPQVMDRGSVSRH